MNKVQFYEDLGKILYLLCDYISEESDQCVKEYNVRDVLQRSFDEIADIYEELEGDEGMYCQEQLLASAL